MTRLLTILLLALAAAPARAQNAAVIRTLREAYSSSLANSDSIAISEQAIRQAEALYRRAFGFALPEISLRHESSWQDRQSGNARIPQPGPQSDGMIRLSQSGLNGYRELAAVKTAKAISGQRLHERLRAEQLLLTDIAAAFYGVLRSRENAISTQQLLELADRRLGELRERVRVGRTREADSIAQEFQSASLRSQLEETLRQAQGGSDLLAFFARSPVDPQMADEGVPAEERPLEHYMARIESRPDVVAARDALEAAVGTVRVSRSDRLPQLGYQMNYYGYRPLNQQYNDWDISFSAALPIFNWGTRSSAVEASKAVLTAQERSLQLTRRSADLEVRNAHRDHATARRQLDIRRRAVDLARRDYELQTRDEKRGLVTSLEVLESLNRLNNARLNFNSALLDARLTALGLELTAGARPEDVLR